MKYKKFSFYPNVRAAETLIWDRFIDKFPDAYDSVDYNVKVGEGADIPEGTQPGQVFRLKGKGLPVLNANRTGDHYVTVNVEIPRKLGRAERRRSSAA